MAFAVRDEDDILDLKLRHHLDCGFSHFHIINHGSNDGCADILARYVDLNCVSLIQKHRDAPASNSWIAELMDAARARNPSAYLTICDTDEFIFPQKPLADVMDGETAYALPRKNCFPDRESLSWTGQDLFSVFRNMVDQGHDTTPFRLRIQRGEPLGDVFDSIDFPIFFQDLSAAPKLFFPLEKVEELRAGAHHVAAWAQAGRNTLVAQEALTIRHFPLRSLAGLRRRTLSYLKYFKDNPDLPNGWGWQNRYIIHLGAFGQLQNEWNRHILPADLDMLADGPCRITRIKS